MPQDGELKRCISICVVNMQDQKRVTEKASEILRKMTTWVPVGSLGKAKSCTHLIAIELACRTLKKMFNKEKLMMLTQIGSKDYQQAVNNTKSLLKLTFSKTAAIDVLAVQSGMEYKTPALDLLKEYHKNYVTKLEKSRQALINLESSEYQAAAFLVVSKAKKAAERNRVCDICDASPKLVQNIMDELERMRMRAGLNSEGGDGDGDGDGDMKQKPTRLLSKGQSQQKALKLQLQSQIGSTSTLNSAAPAPASSSSSSSSKSTNRKEGVKVHKISSLRQPSAFGEKDNLPLPALEVDATDPLMGVLDRLTSGSRRNPGVSVGSRDFASADALMTSNKGSVKQSVYEIARAKEAEKARREAEEKQMAADKKRARFESWKEGLLKKGRRTTA